MRAWLLLACLSGCGRLGFDTRELASGADAETRIECWDRWRTGTLVVAEPRKLDELGTGKHTNPSIAADGLTLYFENVDANDDVFSSTRTEHDAAWSAPARVAALATTAREGRFSTSGDGRFGVLTSGRGGDMDLWTTERTSTTAPFGAPTQALVMSLRTTKNELDPELSPDGLRIYYAPLDGMQRIRMARREPGGVFAVAAELAELQISSAVADPTLSPDETVIAFSSGATAGENDLYYAVRTNRDATFGEPRAIPAINRAPNINDGDIDLSADGCEIYFVSDRAGTPSIYVALVQ